MYQNIMMLLPFLNSHSAQMTPVTDLILPRKDMPNGAVEIPIYTTLVNLTVNFKAVAALFTLLVNNARLEMANTCDFLASLRPEQTQWKSY
jgi:hypothetical protein